MRRLHIFSFILNAHDNETLQSIEDINVTKRKALKVLKGTTIMRNMWLCNFRGRVAQQNKPIGSMSKTLVSPQKHVTSVPCWIHHKRALQGLVKYFALAQLSLEKARG